MQWARDSFTLRYSATARITATRVLHEYTHTHTHTGVEGARNPIENSVHSTCTFHGHGSDLEKITGVMSTTNSLDSNNSEG